MFASGVPAADTMFKLEAPEGFTMPSIAVSQVPDIKGLVLPPGITGLNSKDKAFLITCLKE